MLLKAMQGKRLHLNAADGLLGLRALALLLP
jgi:hypothetical protein